jgi:hypothetical protein
VPAAAAAAAVSAPGSTGLEAMRATERALNVLVYVLPGVSERCVIGRDIFTLSGQVTDKMP